MIGLDVLFGGLTGLLGNAITSWFKYKNTKMENEHEENMVKLKTQATIQEAQMQIEVTKTKVKGDIEKADTQAFDTSQKYGNVRLFDEKWIDMFMELGKERKWTGWIYTIIGTIIAGCFAFVDWLNTLMRPTLTIYLVLTTTYITFLSWKVIEGAGMSSITPAQAVGLFTQVTSTVIFLATSAVTWWFGDRTVSKYLQQRDARRERTQPLLTDPTTGKPKSPSVNTQGGGGGDVDL